MNLLNNYDSELCNYCFHLFNCDTDGSWDWIGAWHLKNPRVFFKTTNKDETEKDKKKKTQRYIQYNIIYKCSVNLLKWGTEKLY